MDENFVVNLFHGHADQLKDLEPTLEEEVNILFNWLEKKLIV